MLNETKSLLNLSRAAEPAMYPEFIKVINARLASPLPNEDRIVLAAELDRLEADNQSPRLPGWLGGSTFRG
jgi:hypothetical protein